MWKVHVEILKKPLFFNNMQLPATGRCIYFSWHVEEKRQTFLSLLPMKRQSDLPISQWSISAWTCHCCGCAALLGAAPQPTELDRHLDTGRNVHGEHPNPTLSPDTKSLCSSFVLLQQLFLQGQSRALELALLCLPLAHSAGLDL